MGSPDGTEGGTSGDGSYRTDNDRTNAHNSPNAPPLSDPQIIFSITTQFFFSPGTVEKCEEEGKITFRGEMFSKADNFDSQDGESLIERKQQGTRRVKLVTAAKEVSVVVVVCCLW